ncbi:hypothetical protein QOZ80_5AG0392280 [Eleusine coracana subsp. coracana]|nr:hypothetical protein QOZ80_5AG0392280 [Eleusine coracana subsp. coracana]
MKPPFIYLTPSVAASEKGSLLKAALDGNLGRLKGIIKNLGMGPAAIFSVIIDGFGVLHCAAAHGHLEVCKYLVEELGGDPNMAAGVAEFEGVTPFIFSVHSEDVSIVKYFLDHGGDPMKADAKGRSVLHYAVCTGSCKITEFLLSQGIPVDIDCGNGTPLLHAASNNEDKTLKILLDHNANPNGNFVSPLMNAFINRSLNCMELLIKAGADVNCKGSLVSPLLFATGQGGYTDLIPSLLKAGADPNSPDDLGWLPIERAALRKCREEVKMLLPLTSPIPKVPNWTVDGVISYAEFKSRKPLAKEPYNKRIAIFKSQAANAFKQKKYAQASKNYSLLMQDKPSATLYSNRSLCKLRMGDGKGALSDAKQCRMMRPGWAKACYRQGAAHMLLKEYKQACDAFLDAEKLDPGNEEIERELRKAMELMKNSPEQ